MVAAPNVPLATCWPMTACCNGRSYRSARTVTTQQTPCWRAMASVDRKRSRSLLSATVQHSSNWSTTSTKGAGLSATIASISPDSLVAASGLVAT